MAVINPYASGNSISIGSPANGLSLASGVLSIAAADDTHAGVVSTGTQTFAGDKTFSGDFTANSFTAAAASGTLGLVTPAGSYLALNLAGTAKIRWNAGGGYIQYVSSGYHHFDGQVWSGAAAGAEAFAVGQNGPHWHVGAGESDYFSSDGNTISFASPIAAVAVQLNTSATARPTAAAGNRGTLWFTPSASGAADKLEICLKSAGDTYSWVQIVTG